MLDENTSSPLIIDPCNRLKGWSFEAHTTYLPRSTDDDKVAAFCGPRNWGLVTLDEMRYTPETCISLVAHKVRVFKVITRKDSVFTEVAATLVTAREKIIEIMRVEKEAMCAHVRLNGDVVIMSRFNEYRGMAESRLRSIRKFHKMGTEAASQYRRMRS